MKKIIIHIGFLVVVFLNSWPNLYAQSLQSDILLLDNQRMVQMQDSLNVPIQSFAIRSSSMYWANKLNEPFSKRSKGKFTLVQVGYSLQNNSTISVGWNDGSFYPAVGLQQRFTVGAHYQYRNWAVHLQPEFVSAANKDPQAYTIDPSTPNFIARYYLYIINKLDNHYRFGTASINSFFPGQSSIRYNTKNTSIGLSTENLWWGPGIRNSLVLTNNAPGFVHLTYNSIKPIHTNWGNIEFQAVLGQLHNAQYEAPDNEYMRTVWADGIAKKPDVARGMFGYILSWNPKWTKNLHIGITGASYFYMSEAEVNTTNPLILPYENKQKPASLGALFFRYVMPKEQAEVYMEYGRSNRWANPFNIFGDTIPTGYTAGFRKLFKQPHHKGGIMLSAEITQLQLPDARSIFNPESVYGPPKTNSWYTNAFMGQGYSNNGQVMGASIGPGSNSQTINITWVKGLKRIGLHAERIAYNNDFYTYNFFSGTIGSGVAYKQWADLNLGLQAQWDFDHFLLNASILRTKSLNYRWTKLENTFADPSPLSDRLNTQVQLGLSYFFKRL
ncbi:MAG: capsule assembly Wzi family protein [Sediminibacterium sp.]|nr:capsule assembly Wzi family protein [Sediminibacterium sp.]